MENTERYTLLKLAVPIAFEAFFQMLFGFTDTYVLSSYSDLAVAAAGYVNQFLGIVLLIFRVAASGTSILLTQSIGAQDKGQQDAIGSAAFWLSICLGIGSFLLIFLLRRPIINLLILNRELQKSGLDYLEMMSFGLFFQSVFAVFTSLFRSYGKAAYASAIAIIANLLNVIGDLLVVGGHFHFFGTMKDVALVTVIANSTAVLVTFILLISSKNLLTGMEGTGMHKRKRIWDKPDKKACREIIALGNALRAAGDVRYPVVISVLSMWGIGTALAWFFGVGLGLGLPGIFAAFFLDEMVRALLLLRRWKGCCTCCCERT